MTIDIREIDSSEYELVRQLLMTNGWSHRVDDGANFYKLLENSHVRLVALKDHRIIGFIRAITDQISNGYISMLVVHPYFRRQGIGKALINAAISYVNPSVTWVLRPGRPGAADFFAAIGFNQSEEAMELKRRSV
jgi:ribosomal protein S18 acetylase RimI-like enzyme